MPSQTESKESLTATRKRKETKKIMLQPESKEVKRGVILLTIISTEYIYLYIFIFIYRYKNNNLPSEK